MYRFLTDLHETGDIFIIIMIFKNFQPKQNVIPTLLIRCVFTCDRSYMTNFQMQTQTPETNMIFMPVCLHCSSTMLIFLKIQIWIFHKTSVSLWQRFEHQSVYLTLQKKKKIACVFYPESVCIGCCEDDFNENTDPKTSQEYGFAPVCVRI